MKGIARYNKEQVESYLRFRATSSEGSVKKIDHGIAGGLMIFDALDKMFKRAWAMCSESPGQTEESFIIKKGRRILHVSSNHYKAYGEIADGIIAHNMWMSAFDKCNPVIDKTTKISIENLHLFVLSLSDTLEPAKRNLEFLSRITIDKVVNGIKLHMTKEVYNSVYASVSDLEDWVAAKVLVTNAGEDIEVEITKGDQ